MGNYNQTLPYHIQYYCLNEENSPILRLTRSYVGSVSSAVSTDQTQKSIAEHNSKKQVRSSLPVPLIQIIGYVSGETVSINAIEPFINDASEVMQAYENTTGRKN